MFGRITLASAIALAFASSSLADEENWITLAQSPPFVASSDQAQRWSESINIKKGQEKLALSLTYYNGSESTPGFKWLRIASPSMNFVSEGQFAGKKSLTVDATGELTWDGNQLLLSGAGPKGATFSWALRTPQPTITGVTSGTIFPGNQIVVTGANLCPDPSADQVLINGTAAHIISAAQNQLTVQVPEDLKSGSYSIAVNTAGLNAAATAPLNISVLARPYLKSLSSTFVAPGEQLTIYGEGFSADLSKDVVYLGPFSAEIVEASPNSITVVAPGALSDAWYGMFYKVRIRVNGIPARNTLTVESHNV